MATTVTTATTICSMSAYPSGTLAWVACDVSTAGDGETEITAAAIIDKAQGIGATGKIVQVFDGGGMALVLNGAATGVSVCNLPSAGEGNVIFRSAVDGTTNAAVKQLTNLKLQCLIRF